MLPTTRKALNPSSHAHDFRKWGDGEVLEGDLATSGGAERSRAAKIAAHRAVGLLQGVLYGFL